MLFRSFWSEISSCLSLMKCRIKWTTLEGLTMIFDFEIFFPWKPGCKLLLYWQNFINYYRILLNVYRYVKDGKVGESTLAPTRASATTTVSSMLDLSIMESTVLKGSSSGYIHSAHNIVICIV